MRTAAVCLFDERNLVEINHPDHLGERLIVCRNPELSKLRSHKRHGLLEATGKELEKVRASGAAGRLKGKDKIGVRVGRVVNKYKVAKHFELTIEEQRFELTPLKEQICAEAALDGIYVVRTALPKRRMSAADTVRNHKALANVERAFRSLKTGPESASDPPSARGSCARPHLPVHARLLCRVAHARGLAVAALRR
jgi:hypothetical protein